MGEVHDSADHVSAAEMIGLFSPVTCALMAEPTARAGAGSGKKPIYDLWGIA